MNPLSRRQFFATAGSVAGATLASETEGARSSNASVTLACADYLRFTPFATGDLRPDDLDLTLLRGPRSEMLRRASNDATISGGEGSMLGHLLRVDQGDRSLVAVPVFPLRNFTVRDIYVRKGSPLTTGTLNGRSIGIYNWAASGAVWYRHLLRYFGQNPASMAWIVGGADRPARIQSRAPLPPNVTNAPPDKSLTDLLMAGELDAFCTPIPPAKFHRENGLITRLVPDFVSAEKRYFEKTRCFPTQHVLLLHKEVFEKSHAIGRSLVSAFDACETRFQEGQHLFPYSTPWLIEDVEATRLLMGAQFHAHGLEKNRTEIDTFCQAGFDDGLTKRRVSVEEYFAEFLKS